MNKKKLIQKTNLENLIFISKELKEFDPFVYFGTLLGLTRENNVLINDDDIDLPFVPDRLIMNIGDCHIYKSHYEQVTEQITRKPYSFPQIKIKDRTKSVIYLNSKLKLIKKHNNKLEKFDFPLSSVFTEKIYQNINIEKYPYKFINYKYAKDLSILILNLFVKKSIKNIAIR